MCHQLARLRCTNLVPNFNGHFLHFLFCTFHDREYKMRSRETVEAQTWEKLPSIHSGPDMLKSMSTGAQRGANKGTPEKSTTRKKVNKIDEHIEQAGIDNLESFTDPSTNTIYYRLKVLGKGGFAKGNSIFKYFWLIFKINFQSTSVAVGNRTSGLMPRWHWKSSPKRALPSRLSGWRLTLKFKFKTVLAMLTLLSYCTTLRIISKYVLFWSCASERVSRLFWSNMDR